MKTITKRIATLGMLVLLLATNAYAQPIDAGASSTAKPASSIKAVRAADRALQKSVRRALAKTRGLDVLNIDVRAHDGAVVLEGSVPDQSQIDVATRAAQSVPGVASVRNALVIHVLQ